MADYVTWALGGDDTYFANQIKRIADLYLKGDCINLGTKVIRENPYYGIEISIPGQGGYYQDVQLYHFTRKYCTKLKAIVKAQNVKNYVLHAVVTDPEFVNHIIKDTDTYEYTHPFTDQWEAPPQTETKPSLISRQSDPSPIKELIEGFKQVHEYVIGEKNNDTHGKNVMAAIILFALPIGTALRVIKTTMELYF